MTTDLAIVLGLLAAAVTMFAINRPRMDVVAILVMVALPLTGIITLDEALAGFSDPNIILIAALFVLGEALVRTGVAQRTGDLLVRHSGASEMRLVMLLMASVAGIGAFMSSTGVVAIFIPIVLRIAANIGTAPGRLMMPLSAAALISGMMTLVATAPNLVLDSLLRREGHQGFGFFDFTPFGVPILVLAIGYMLVARRWLAVESPAAPASRPRLADWIDSYGLAEREFRLRLGASSTLMGKRLDQLDLRGTAGVNILGIERSTPYGRRLIQPKADSVLQADDVLFLDVFRKSTDIEAFCTAHGLHRLPISGAYFTDRAQEIGMVELIVPPGSPLAGKSIAQSRFRSVYGLAIVGLRRDNQPDEDVDAQTVLRGGDVLLAIGRWNRIRQLHRGRDLVVLAAGRGGRGPGGAVPRRSRRDHPWAGGGDDDHRHRAERAGGADRLSADGAFRLRRHALGLSLDPLAKPGADRRDAALLARPAKDRRRRPCGRRAAGDDRRCDPRIALAVIFATTALLGLFISNTATAVLMVRSRWRWPPRWACRPIPSR